MSECNSPAEMGRRIVYLAYWICSMGYMSAAVIAIARPRVAQFLLAVGLFGAAYGVRYVGFRWLDFERLTFSFPGGCPMDLVPDEIRKEVTALCIEFHDSRTGWIRRSEIRKRLIELEEISPSVKQAFEQELKTVLR